jgi:exodeoxyribonuclease VII large subunit
LTENEYGFVFHTALFPAIMQGQGAASSIMEALDRIIEVAVPFDVVVIIRGGGAVADLSCFDEYDLCYFATQYPLPLLTGLGHDKDNAILDRVAHTSVKTPTAAAEKLLDTLLDRAGELDNKAERLMRRVNQVLETEKLDLHTMPGRLVSRVQDRLLQAKMKVEQTRSGLREQAAHTLMQGRQQNTLFVTRLSLACRTAVAHQTMQVKLLEQSVNSFSPSKMLERGFSLTLHQGKPLRSVKDLKEGTTVETRLADGHFTSTVHSKHQYNER